MKVNLKVKVATTFASVAILSAAYSTHASASTTQYIVKKGDTLSKIALIYKTNVKDLKTVNGLRSDLIFINQKLAVPSAKQTVTIKPNPVPQAPPASASASAPGAVYTVVKGDTLGKIAIAKKTTVADLKKWNNLKSDLILIGQKLTVSAPATPSQPVTPKPAAPAPVKPAQPAPTPAAPAKYQTYTVKSGDTLGRISIQFKTTVSELKALNKLTSDLIRIGQVLQVPGAVQAAPAPTVSAPPAAEGDAAVVIAKAKEMLGTPYVWGGSAPGGFDCSGFIYYVYNQAGKKMNRFSADGYYNRSYYVDAPKPGDLVFFENTYKKGISHVGIYVGDNQFIHASEKGVIITNLDQSYYKKHFESFKRFY
ncbi:peptidoglycan endopeptidase [Neobacillus notoginsengisoli]|uniref:Peptidoglycan endopeptidase n=2 Tax=Neobacillus notoginsengisoli TaxID=1578198 RepID=A0A417YRB2_9BACI|nr:peptidoglycan endopeptidase [Neobacillus notoginsengisoli]